MKNLMTATFGLLAGILLAISAKEPTTHATPHVEPTPIVIPEATPVVVTPVITPDETAPQPVAEEGEPSPLAFVATDCPGGVCSQPRAAATIRKSLIVQRPRLFSRLRIRR